MEMSQITTVTRPPFFPVRDDETKKVGLKHCFEPALTTISFLSFFVTHTA